MPTPTITVRLPLDIREALTAQAAEAGLPLRTYIVSTLTGVSGLAGERLGVTPQASGGKELPGLEVAPAPVSPEPEPEPVKACLHPRDRRRNVVGGKVCLVCGEHLAGV